MNTPIKNIFPQWKKQFNVVKESRCKTGQTLFKTLQNSNEYGGCRFATFFSYLNEEKRTDYMAKACYIPVDVVYKNGDTVNIYGTSFTLQERVAKKGGTYLAVLLKGRKVGIYSSERKCFTLNNICL